jgi:hypothetical protein
MSKTIFTKKDVGCYGDHSFGWDHVRHVLADLITSSLKFGPEADKLAKELRSEPPDDYSDEQDALDLLNQHTEEGLVWVIDQDLLLR